jgi:hypothetical protein
MVRPDAGERFAIPGAHAFLQCARLLLQMLEAGLFGQRTRRPFGFLHDELLPNCLLSASQA